MRSPIRNNSKRKSPVLQVWNVQNYVAGFGVAFGGGEGTKIRDTPNIITMIFQISGRNVQFFVAVRDTESFQFIRAATSLRT